MATTQVALAIVMNSVNQMLIIQRKKVEQGKDGAVLSWAYPGGKVELDETGAEAAARELLEETGYHGVLQAQISERQHPQFDVHISYFAFTLNEEIPQQSIAADEVVQVQWIDPGASQFRGEEKRECQRWSKVWERTAERIGIKRCKPVCDQRMPGPVKRALNCLAADSTMPEPMGKPFSRNSRYCMRV
ncbi:MAG: NUDIX hydrolase [Caldilineaceae bacterium]|nr:NUDIX hydrolase [Caldilineaceae bacterium]